MDRVFDEIAYSFNTNMYTDVRLGYFLMNYFT